MAFRYLPTVPNNVPKYKVQQSNVNSNSNSSSGTSNSGILKLTTEQQDAVKSKKAASKLEKAENHRRELNNAAAEEKKRLKDCHLFPCPLLDCNRVFSSQLRLRPTPSKEPTLLSPSLTSASGQRRAPWSS